MKDTYRRTRHVRIISQKEKELDIYKLYVESSFSCDNENVKDSELVQRIRDGENVIVNGVGGAGKTFFMRHLWLTLFAEQGQHTPLFVELRRLNDQSTVNLVDFICELILPKRRAIKQ